MNHFRKLSGIAAIVLSLAGAGCVNRSQRELELEAYATNSLPKIMEKQERDLRITYEEKVPNVSVAEEKEGMAAQYSIFFEEIVLLTTELTEVFGEENRKKVENSISHELGHHYLNLRSKALDGWPFELSLDYLNPFREGLLVYGVGQNEQESEQRNENVYNKLVLEAVLIEGIAEYFATEKLYYLYHFCKDDFPETSSEIMTIDSENYIVYAGGYHLIKPLMDEFGVQRVVDYIITHEPEVTGKLREDVLRYQKQVQDALRGELKKESEGEEK